MKKLNATGKGEWIYDSTHDLLMFKVKDRDYKESVEFQNFVADIDTEGFITGIRIFDASKIFGIDRYALKNIIKGEFRGTIESNTITIRVSFVAKRRNKEIPVEQFTQQITSPMEHAMANSSVECIAA